MNRPLSVIATLLVHDNPWSALRTIRGVRAQTTPVDRLIIVDNGSRTPLIDDFHRTGEHLRANEALIRSPSNRGVGAGHNTAIEKARRAGCELVWILEQDTFIDPDCLVALLDLRTGADDEVAIPLLARNEYERVGLDKEPPVYDGNLRPSEDGHLVTFNGILVSVNLLDRVGVLREDLQIGFEDRDFARRVLQLGGRLVVSRRVLGIHPTRGNGRFPEPVAPERLYYSVRNQLISRREIGERPEFRRVARALGAATRALINADPASAAARVRGVRDGVRTPVVRTKVDLATGVVVTAGPRAPERSPEQSWTCRACGEETGGIVVPVVSWRSLPDRIPFPYGECRVCGSLTLLDPVDPSGYYDADYDRLAPRSTAVTRQRSRSVVGAVGRWAGSVDVLSRVAILDRAAPSWYGWFRGLHVTARSRILDVGCGNGALLFHLRSFGFKELRGIDPFLVAEHVGSGLSIERHCLDRVDGRFQVILFNHSLEHVDNPGELLNHARTRLQPGGGIIVQVPIVGGAAWRRYRDNLGSLDAPLHRFIPTPNGITRLACRHQLTVARWRGESTLHYYRQSELIRFGVPCNRPELIDGRRLQWAQRVARREHGAEAAQASFVLVPR